jgi:hypothetical protein
VPAHAARARLRQRPTRRRRTQHRRAQLQAQAVQDYWRQQCYG